MTEAILYLDDSHVLFLHIFFSTFVTFTRASAVRRIFTRSESASDDVSTATGPDVMSLRGKERGSFFL